MPSNYPGLSSDRPTTLPTTRDRLSHSLIAAASPQSAQVPVLPVLLLLASDIYRNVAMVIGLDRVTAQYATYGIWFVGAVLIAPHIRSRQPVVSTAAVRFAILMVVLLPVTTLLLYWSGRRPVTTAMELQVVALMYMSIAFFTMNAAAKVASVSTSMMILSHAILAISIFSILLDFAGYAQFFSGQGRFFGFMGDPAAWVLTFPLVVYFSNGRFVLAAVAIIGLALTASRAPALCVVAALLLLLIFSRGRRVQYFFTLVPIAVIGIFQSGIFATLFGRIGGTSFTSSDRQVTALLGLKIFRDSPIYGAGYNSFTYYFPRSAHNMEMGQLPTQTSTFAQMLSDGGLLLFLPYLGFVIAATVAALAVMKRSRAFPDSGPINGAAAWLLAMLWVNQSATWWVVASYFGPLVLGIAGVVVGYWARIRAMPRTDPAWGLASPILPA